jgi:hypothetical protein
MYSPHSQVSTLLLHLKVSTSRNDGAEPPPHHGSRPPAHTHRERGSKSPSQVFKKQRVANLTRLYLSQCGIGDDGFIALVSALEQNTSLIHLDLRYNNFSQRAFLALAESLPEIKVLQRVDLRRYPDLVSAMPLLLAGLRKNTSLFRIHVAHCAPFSVPPTPEETARCAGGWMQEMERLGYRNRFLL